MINMSDPHIGFVAAAWGIGAFVALLMIAMAVLKLRAARCQNARLKERAGA